MQNPTPTQIIVTAAGAPTCRDIALTVRRLESFGYDQVSCPTMPYDFLVQKAADRAIRDGYVLCLRPTADRPACVGLTATAFAVASLQEDFAARALVVDPYDAEGNDIREALPPKFEEPIGPTNGAGFYDDDEVLFLIIAITVPVALIRDQRVREG